MYGRYSHSRTVCVSDHGNKIGRKPIEQSWGYRHDHESVNPDARYEKGTRILLLHNFLGVAARHQGARNSCGLAETILTACTAGAANQGRRGPSHTWRRAEALLRARVDGVDAPGVREQRHAAQRANRVHRQQGVVFPAQVAEPCAGAGRMVTRAVRAKLASFLRVWIEHVHPTGCR